MSHVNWLELFSSIDHFLLSVAQGHGLLAYAALFAIVFAETGIVVMAFLPGDSMLFISGAMSAGGTLHPVPLVLTITLAAVLGNALNFLIGSWFGHKIYDGTIRWINRHALDRTHAFFERHGGKTVVVARFIPLVRSFAPLVAGASGMASHRFQVFNVVGAVLWSVLFIGGGYLFGNVPLIRDHLGLVLLAGLSGAFGPVALMGLLRLVRRVRLGTPAA